MLQKVTVNCLQADERRGAPEAERPTATGAREDPRIRPRLCTQNQGRAKKSLTRSAVWKERQASLPFQTALRTQLIEENSRLKEQVNPCSLSPTF
ncbi:hypothetical protein Zm00014a_032005 [Zea mays]|uniref:Uncharacterized protein n=1 Tax=Zea mays TaxID=4577 RepID=A0A317Y819_MAIZE|nr:hypothetical protein Zm00014a_032005 [Zea mays]PWZ54796.1 hypothetical protein Zm00014a_032005 [Zea mays]